MELQNRTGTVGVNSGIISVRIHESLVYLGNVAGPHLIYTEILIGDSLLRDVMYMDLSNFWNRNSGAAVTRTLYLS